MEDAELATIAALLLMWALVSGRVARLPVTAPMVFIAAGVVLGPEAFDVVELQLDQSAVLLLAEATLTVVLFSDAVRIDVRHLRREVGLPARMLGIGLPLTIATGTALFLAVLPGVTWQQAGLLGAILAPTDAALGQAVVTERRVPERIRQTLNVESGLNDGLALPAVAVFLALTLASEDGRTTGEWVEFVARQIGLGALVGVAAGGAGAWLLRRARGAGWSEGISTQLAGLAVPALAYTVATPMDGNGFIAAFAAGLAFKTVGGEVAEFLTEYAEDSGQLLALVSFLAFGNVLVGPVLGDLGWQVAVCALGALTVVRMVPVSLSLAGSGLRLPSVVFLGWFGPRGLASVLFGLTVLEESGQEVGSSIFAVVAWTVLLSVVAHGASASWAADRYARWYESASGPTAAMIESAPMPGPRIRGEPMTD